jgi:hypothetical protein
VNGASPGSAAHSWPRPNNTFPQQGAGREHLGRRGNTPKPATTVSVCTIAGGGRWDWGRNATWRWCARGRWGPGVHRCAGKDRRKYLLPCPCDRGVSDGLKGKTPRPHTLGESADAGAGHPARWPLGGRRFRAIALHYARTRASAKVAFEQVRIRQYGVEARFPGSEAAPRLSYRPIDQWNICRRLWKLLKLLVSASARFPHTAIQPGERGPSNTLGAGRNLRGDSLRLLIRATG